MAVIIDLRSRRPLQPTAARPAAISLWIVWGGRALAATCLLVLLVRGLHLLLPASWRWLDPSSLQDIDHLLASGVAGSMIGRYFKREVA